MFFEFRVRVRNINSYLSYNAWKSVSVARADFSPTLNQCGGARTILMATIEIDQGPVSLTRTSRAAQLGPVQHSSDPKIWQKDADA